jgi:hypothetical protein
MPCRKRAVADEVGRSSFGRSYDRLFKAPELRSNTYLDCWLCAELELAGPLYATRTTGSVAYLFAGEERLRGVRDVDSLMRWYRDVIDRLRACVERQRSTSSRADQDRHAMVAKAADLDELIRVWHDFYVEWHASAG